MYTAVLPDAQGGSSPRTFIWSLRTIAARGYVLLRVLHTRAAAAAVRVNPIRIKNSNIILYLRVADCKIHTSPTTDEYIWIGKCLEPAPRELHGCCPAFQTI